MYDNRDNIDLGSSNIGKLFSSIFIPTLLGMIFNMAFILTDGIFVGHGIGDKGLAAINLVGPIMMLINGLGLMFGSGFSIVAAIHLSHHNIKAARLCTSQLFIATTIIAIIIGTVCYLLPYPILTFLGTSPELMPYAYEYYIWFIPTCLLLMVETIGLFAIRLDGSPRYAMFSNIIPAIVNLALDYIFIFPCHMGLKGASLATDIGSLIGACMVLYYMFFKSNTLHFHKIKRSLTSLRLSLRNIGYMIRTGASALVGELAVAIMMFIGNQQFLKYLGNDGVAAYSVACYLFPLVYMIYTAVAQSSQPIVSYNYGLGKQGKPNTRKTLRLSITVAVLLGMVISAFFIFISPVVVSAFLTSDKAAYSLASQGLPFYASGLIIMALNIVIIGYLQSIEQSRAAVVYTLLRGIVFMIAAFLLLPIWLGTKGLWLAVPTSEALTIITILLVEGSKKLCKQLQHKKSI